MAPRAISQTGTDRLPEQVQTKDGRLKMEVHAIVKAKQKYVTAPFRFTAIDDTLLPPGVTTNRWVLYLPFVDGTQLTRDALITGVWAIFNRTNSPMRIRADLDALLRPLMPKAGPKVSARRLERVRNQLERLRTLSETTGVRRNRRGQAVDGCRLRRPVLSRPASFETAPRPEQGCPPRSRSRRPHQRGCTWRVRYCPHKWRR